MWNELSDLFAPVRHEDELVAWRIPDEEMWPPRKLERSLSAAGTYVDGKGVTRASVCMKCKPAPCVTYLPHEYEVPPAFLDRHKLATAIPNSKPAKVCPTDAITLGPDSIPVINQDACIHCQLCVTRCPVGVLFWSQDHLEVSAGTNDSIVERRGSRPQAEAETAAWTSKLRQDVTQHWTISDTDVGRVVAAFQDRIKAKRLGQDPFYPLVRNLLRELGLRAFIGQKGNQWRLDCIVVDPFIMAVELKSPGEESALSVGSARQAVENAAIVQARYRFAPDPLSIVIGYLLPPDRSDVSRALSDVHASYGVSVGLYTVGTLLYLLLRHLLYRFHKSLDLETLFRGTFGACDYDAVSRFWAEYFKLRLEMVARGETYEGFAKLIDNIPTALAMAMDARDLVALWHREIRLVDAVRATLFPQSGT